LVGLPFAARCECCKELGRQPAVLPAEADLERLSEPDALQPEHPEIFALFAPGVNLCDMAVEVKADWPNNSLGTLTLGVDVRDVKLPAFADRRHRETLSKANRRLQRMRHEQHRLPHLIGGVFWAQPPRFSPAHPRRPGPIPDLRPLAPSRYPLSILKVSEFGIRKISTARLA
jgi:hypothetical protein